MILAPEWQTNTGRLPDVSGLVDQSRHAQATLSEWDDDAIDDLVKAVAWRLYEINTAHSLNKHAVDECGIGNVEEMTARTQARIVAALREMSGSQTLGLIDSVPELGLTKYAKPVGVIAAITPRTAPIAAIAFHTLNALKTRNAVIFCPNPAVIQSVHAAVDCIRATLSEICELPNLVQVVASPNRDALRSLVDMADLVVATGGASTVKAALQVGTPGYGGGVGNPPIIVDETADILLAANEIVRGKSADNGTSCSAESCVLVHKSQAHLLIEAMKSCGVYFLDHEQSLVLGQWMWVHGKLNASVIGRSAFEIADAIGIDVPRTTTCLAIQPQESPENFAMREKLSPVLGFIEFGDIDEAIALARSQLEIEGIGHSLGIYSKSPTNIYKVSTELPVSRIMLNQSTGLGNTGRTTNGMPCSVTLSCGTWGGMNTNENITWRQFLNYTVVSIPIREIVQNPEMLFGRFWNSGLGALPSRNSTMQSTNVPVRGVAIP